MFSHPRRSGSSPPRANDLLRHLGRPVPNPLSLMGHRPAFLLTGAVGRTLRHQHDPAAPPPPGHCSTRSVIARVACASPCQVLVPGVHSPRPKRRSDDGQTILNTALKCWETASGLGKLVELRGLEPLASCMPWGITQVHRPSAALTEASCSEQTGNTWPTATRLPARHAAGTARRIPVLIDQARSVILAAGQSRPRPRSNDGQMILLSCPRRSGRLLNRRSRTATRT